MNVLIIHPSLNRGGGAEKVCLAAIRALMRHGHWVKLVTVERTDWRFLEERFGALCLPSEEAYILERMPIRGKISQAVFTFSFFLAQLVYHRIRGKGDIVVNTYGDLVDSVADISYINALPVRIMHRYPDCSFSSGIVWRFIVQAYSLGLRALDKLFKSALLLTNSTFTQSVVKRHLGRDSLVVFPPVEVNKFGCNIKDTSRGNVVVAVSRLRVEKNLALIPRVAKLAGNGNFVIFGLADQVSQNAVAALTKTIKGLGVEDRVQLLINQPSGKLVDVLAFAKAFLHTQHMEAFGLAVVEAMAAGCVPVVPRDGGPWFDVLNQKQGEFGFSYRSDSEAAQLVNMLLADEDLRNEISVRACDRAKVFVCSAFENKIVDAVNRVYHRKFG
jgi:glycosyltransferase involved in cell wall biosynthesis